jgi:hypothetical protein
MTTTVKRLLSLSLLLPLLAAVLAPAARAQDAQPGPEHKKLTSRAGTWNAVLESMGPDGKPTSSKGVSRQTAACGGLWLIDDFEADFGGVKYHGHGATGYDPAKGKYVATWVDSMSTTLLVMEGNFDATGKVLTMTGTAPGMDGKPVLHRFVTNFQSADTTVFEMFVPMPDGKETKVLTITYTRAPEKGERK